MGFMDSYKRLEKLCGEILDDDRRVSAYIDEMINTPQGRYLVSSWDDDLKYLKHYRWLRNQIVHDPSCTEENMSSFEDAQWVADFYARIINQTDPLALYRKVTQRQTLKKTDSQHYQDEPQWNYNENKTKQCLLGRKYVQLIIFAIIVLAVIWYLLKG